MKVGNLVKDWEGYMGIVITNPRRSADCEGLMEGDIYDVVHALMPWGTEQFATDELEVISAVR